MLHLNAILGSRHDAALADRLHALEHDHAIGRIVLPTADLARHRLRPTNDRGSDRATALARDEHRFDGAVPLIDERRAILIEASERPRLGLHPRAAADALELGWLAGHLRWRVRSTGDPLEVARDAERHACLARLQPLLDGGRVDRLDEPRGDEP